MTMTSSPLSIHPAFHSLKASTDFAALIDNFQRFLKRRWSVAATSDILHPLFPYAISRTWVETDLKPQLSLFLQDYLRYLRHTLLERPHITSELLLGEQAGDVDHEILQQELQGDAWSRLLARPDMALVGNDPRLLELNLGSGMLGHFEYEQLLGLHMDVPAYRQACRDAGLSFVSPYRALAALMDREEAGTVAVVDFCDDFNRTQAMVEYLNRYRQRGKALYVYAPEAQNDDSGRLMVDGCPVDSIYVNMSANFYITPHTKALWQAIKKGKLKTFATLFHKLASSKAGLAMLYQAASQGQLTGDLARLTQRFVPPTAILRDGRCHWQGSEVDLLAYCREHRDSLVLKAANSQAAEQVFMGSYMTQAAWESELSQALSSPSVYVIQDKLTFTTVPHHYWDREAGEMRILYGRALISPYFAGELAAWGVRVGMVEEEGKSVIVSPLLGDCAINNIGLRNDG